jgi:hypothetical protein
MLVWTMLAAAAEAKPPARGDDARMRELVEAALEGSMTPAEKAELIARWPDVAATVPDPNGPEVEGLAATSEPGPLVNAGPVPFATSCKTATGTYTHKSLLGFVIYKYHHKASWCYNGTKTTKVYNRTGWLSNTDGTVKDLGVEVSWVDGVNTSMARSFYQKQVEHCVLKYGCYATTLPRVKLFLYADGHATYNAGV